MSNEDAYKELKMSRLIEKDDEEGVFVIQEKGQVPDDIQIKAVHHKEDAFDMIENPCPNAIRNYEMMWKL